MVSSSCSTPNKEQSHDWFQCVPRRHRVVRRVSVVTGRSLSARLEAVLQIGAGADGVRAIRAGRSRKRCSSGVVGGDVRFRQFPAAGSTFASSAVGSKLSRSEAGWGAMSVSMFVSFSLKGEPRSSTETLRFDGVLLGRVEGLLFGFGVDGEPAWLRTLGDRQCDRQHALFVAVGVVAVTCAATGFGGHGRSGVATGQLRLATTTPAVVIAVVELSTLTGTITTTGEVASRVITGSGPATTDATGSVGVAIV